MSDFFDLIPCPKCWGSALSRDDIAAMLRSDRHWHCNECGFLIEGPYWCGKPYPTQTFADLLGEATAARVRFALALMERFEPKIIYAPTDRRDVLWLLGPGVLEDEGIIALARAAGVREILADED